MFVPRCHWMEEMGWRMWHYRTYSIQFSCTNTYICIMKMALEECWFLFSDQTIRRCIPPLCSIFNAAICQGLTSFNHIRNWTKHKEIKAHANTTPFKCGWCTYLLGQLKKKMKTSPRLLRLEMYSFSENLVWNSVAKNVENLLSWR